MPKGIYIRTKPVWNKGLTKEMDERVRKYTEAKIGRPRFDMVGNSFATGYQRSKDLILQQISVRRQHADQLGYYHSEETKKKIGSANVISVQRFYDNGGIAWSLGKKRSKDSINKMRLAPVSHHKYGPDYPDTMWFNSRGEHSQFHISSYLYLFDRYGKNAIDSYIKFFMEKNSDFMSKTVGSFIRHHTYGRKYPNILKITGAVHTKLHFDAYFYIFDVYGKQGIDEYINWFSKIKRQ